MFVLEPRSVFREGVLETLQHLQRLGSYGVEWYSYREEYLRSIGVFKEAVLAILAAVAKQERIRLSERVQAGAAAREPRARYWAGPRRRCGLSGSLNSGNGDSVSGRLRSRPA